jgi:glycosyltransferase involved in cell wall biosynthesis
VAEARKTDGGCALSVVVPVYGCAGCLYALHERVTAAIETITPDFEIVLVEDRGDDGSWEVIEQLVAGDARVRGFRLSRNFGQHAAITAGLEQAKGQWTVVMDCDLQDPPEEIPRLYAKATEGYDVVFGLRREKPGALPRRLLARAYFRALKTFAGSQFEGQWGTFSILSGKVVRAFLQFRDNDRHYLMILHWLGFRTAAVEYQPAERFAGRSSYSFRRLLKHAADGMFFQTTVLLRWIVYLGFALAIAGAMTAVYLAVARLSNSFYPGWTSIAVFTLLIGGFIIISTGITGLYIGKVFEQVKGRPLFLIDEVRDRAEDREHQRQLTP